MPDETHLRQYLQIGNTLQGYLYDGVSCENRAGALVFDAASFDSDIDGYIVPFPEELGITPAMLKYVFISHNHIDHAGGLSAFMKKYPETCIVSRILTAHDYHPCGYDYKGKTEISRALDSCIEPLVMVKDLILQNPELDDEQIAALFDRPQTLPTLGERVVAAMRELIKNG